MPDDHFDDAMTCAIRDNILFLQQNRDNYFAVTNNKLHETRLAAYFIEEFERRGGVETAKTLRKVWPNNHDPHWAV